MKAQLDCFSCFLRIGLQTARMAGASESQQQLLMKRFLDHLSHSIDGESPLAVAHQIQAIVREEMGVVDPYLNRST